VLNFYRVWLRVSTDKGQKNVEVCQYFGLQVIDRLSHSLTGLHLDRKNVPDLERTDRPAYLGW
jgi:hypothetical protein